MNDQPSPPNSHQPGESRAPIGVGPLAPPLPPPYPPAYYPPPPASGGGRAGRIFGWGISGLLISLLLVSLGVNLWLGNFFVMVTSGPHELVYTDGLEDQRIVILPVEGLIDEQTHDYVRRSLQMLRQNQPKALVLRVDSGGGYVGPSDRIYDELKRFKAETNIPIVASFGSLAASGGYYISAGADHIVAEPTCLTGSIGVMATAFTVEKLMEKIGVTPEIRVAEDSPAKDVANNIFRPWDERDRAKLQDTLNHAHTRFVEVVFEGRRTQLKTRERALELANGDIFTAEQALTNKLVDAQGYLAEAIEQAKQLAGVTQPQVTVIHQPVSLGLRGLLGWRRDTSVMLDGPQLRRCLTELSTLRLEFR